MIERKKKEMMKRDGSFFYSLLNITIINE